MDNPIIEVEFRVSGRVQYVMFRDFAKRKADKIGVKGFVKNNNDGTVTVVAQGHKDLLSKFEKKLWQGSLLSKVENIQKIVKATNSNFSDFRIIYE